MERGGREGREQKDEVGKVRAVSAVLSPPQPECETPCRACLCRDNDSTPWSTALPPVGWAGLAEPESRHRPAGGMVILQVSNEGTCVRRIATENRAKEWMRCGSD